MFWIKFAQNFLKERSGYFLKRTGQKILSYLFFVLTGGGIPIFGSAPILTAQIFLFYF